MWRLKTFLLYSLAQAVILQVSVLWYFPHSLFYCFLNASYTLALLLFLYWASDRSASYISIFKMAAVILLNLSHLVGRINGFILGQSQWAIVAYIVLYSLLIYSFVGPSYVLSIQATASSSRYIQSGGKPILYSSTAIGVNLYAPIIVRRYRFCTISSQYSLVLLISLGFIHSSNKYQVLYLYKIAGWTTAEYIIHAFQKEAPYIEAISQVSAAI